MIKITEKNNCCGCSACASICPKQCIKMVDDNEGFSYPLVDRVTCVDCGLCEKVCNELHPYKEREPLKVLAAINRNEDIRLKSSSGGIFYILAEKIINEGGVVFGTRFDKNWQVVIDYAENMEDVEAFMGSKYVQARIDNAYREAKRFLAKGRKVLFSATPCQIAGLNKFLRNQKISENLLTVDFICHGVPSPKVWQIYLDEITRGGKCISNVEFRNKKEGWKTFSFNLTYNDNNKNLSIFSVFHKNPYMKAFLQDIILRPSCYDCKVKGCSSQSDITIADFWGIEKVFPEMDDDKGTGLIFVNTEKGNKAIDFSQIKYAETTYEQIKPLNPACYRSPEIHQKREVFFSLLQKENIIDLINKYTKQSVKQRLKTMIKRYASKIILLLRHKKRI